MNTPLDCPVCGYKEVPENICPNCDTNLDSLRLLIALPEAPVATISSLNNRIVLISVLSIILLSTLVGAGIAFTLSQISKLTQIQPQDQVLAVSTMQPKEMPSPLDYPQTSTLAMPIDSSKNINVPELVYVSYRVRYGDTLSDIAQRFDLQLVDLIEANIKVQGRKNQIYEGEMLNLPLYGTPTSHNILN